MGNSCSHIHEYEEIKQGEIKNNGPPPDYETVKQEEIQRQTSLNNEEILNMLKCDWTKFKNIQNQTEDLIISAIKINWRCIKYAKIRNAKIYKEVFVNIQADKLEDFYNGVDAYRKINDDCYEFYSRNIKNEILYKLMVLYFEPQLGEKIWRTEKLSMDKADYDKFFVVPRACKYVYENFVFKEKDWENIYEELLAENGLRLIWVKKQTKRMCKIAIKQNPNATIYIHDYIKL